MALDIVNRWLVRLANTILTPSESRGPGGMKRVVILIVSLVALGLVPIHLRRGWTATAGTIFLIVLALVIVSAAAGFQRFVERLRRPDELKLLAGRIKVAHPGFERELRTFEAWTSVLRQLGLALPALVFFCFWAFVYSLLWAYAPDACSLDFTEPCRGAFRGAGSRPIFGDFIYMAVNLAFTNPPPDLIAQSRVARMAATVEVITGVALLALYAGSFFGFGQRGDAVVELPEPTE